MTGADVLRASRLSKTGRKGHEKGWPLTEKHKRGLREKN